MVFSIGKTYVTKQKNLNRNRMDALVILIIIAFVIFFIIAANRKDKEVEKKYFQDLFDEYRVFDYRKNDFLIKSIKYSLKNEIFEYDKVEYPPIFPSFDLASKFSNFLQDNYTSEISIDKLISILQSEYHDEIDDFVINEIYEEIQNFRKATYKYSANENFCSNYLLEIGLITEESFNLDGSTLKAFRTLRIDKIDFIHPGTKSPLSNFKFSFDSSNETELNNKAIDYFEQILIKILRENDRFLGAQYEDIQNAFKDMTIEKPVKIVKESKYHEQILRINHVLNRVIVDSTPNMSTADFLSLSCESITQSWAKVKENTIHNISIYNELLNAYQNNDLKALNEAICIFERLNYLLSSDTLSIVKSISQFKQELIDRLDDLEYSITGRIDEVQDDMASKLDSVQSTASVAAAAATVSAIQSTRALKRLKK